MSQDYAAGQRLGDYEVLEVLGAGGMGKVYKVRNVISDRIEAMKIILPNLANQKELADRFLREIKLLGSLNHPNIAALRTALTINDQLVMIMEYVEGITLASRLQQGPISPADAINYADQILSALSYAHKLNVIHRDIKPANMMLTPQGVVKLMDFGLARPGEQATAMTATSTTLGSVNYMPPEQVKGESVDARSDIYSLGVSLYEMVTGQLPFQGGSGYSLMTAHIQELPKAPIMIQQDLPKTLNEIILIALAKDPAKRFQSADAFRNALKSVPLGVAAPMANPAVVAKAMASPQLASSRSQVQPPTGVSSAVPTAVFPDKIKPAAAVTASASPAPSAPTNNHRGFYMALGALLVVCVLFGTAFYLPRRIKTHAEPAVPATGLAPAVNSRPAEPASTLSVPPMPSADPETFPASPNASAPGSAPKEALPASRAASPDLKLTPDSSNPKVPVRAASNGPSPARGPATTSNIPLSSPKGQQQLNSPSSAQDASATAAMAAELDQIRQGADQLSSRASAVSQSLDGLRRAQSAQGLGLRGDIVASEQRMQANLSTAQSAMDKQDAEKAKKYLGLADVEVEKLEKFLGR
jgi:eukaryotic-like serine/threonine-protein kinase